MNPRPRTPLAGDGFSWKALAMRAKYIECCFMFGVVWSLGSTGVEAGQKAFLEFLDNIIADLGVIETEWEGVNNALQVGGGRARPCGLVPVSSIDLLIGRREVVSVLGPRSDSGNSYRGGRPPSREDARVRARPMTPARSAAS